LNSTLGVPLRGSAIGNGWIDARRQYPAFLDYVVKHGLVKPGSEVRLPTLENRLELDWLSLAIRKREECN
jgi:hypothetical protein